MQNLVLKYSKLAMLLLCFFIGVASVNASPWVKQAGDAYIKAGFSDYTTESSFDFEGESQDVSPYYSQSVSVYGDVGLGHGLGLENYLQVTTATSAGSTDKGASIWQTGLRYQIAENPAWSIAAITTMPLTNGIDNALLTDRIWEAGLRTEVGASILSGKGYTILGVGYWLPLFLGPDENDGDLAHEFEWFGELGYFVMPQLLCKASIRSRMGIDSTLNNSAKDQSDSGLPSALGRTPSRSFLDASLSAAWGFDEKLSHGVQFDYSRTIWGESASVGQALALGYFFQL
jgi:hypothetical protein